MPIGHHVRRIEEAQAQAAAEAAGPPVCSCGAAIDPNHPQKCVKGHFLRGHTYAGTNPTTYLHEHQPQVRAESDSFLTGVLEWESADDPRIQPITRRMAERAAEYGVLAAATTRVDKFEKLTDRQMTIWSKLQSDPIHRPPSLQQSSSPITIVLPANNRDHLASLAALSDDELIELLRGLLAARDARTRQDSRTTPAPVAAPRDELDAGLPVKAVEPTPAPEPICAYCGRTCVCPGQREDIRHTVDRYVSRSRA
jgi:hypothetical protein